MPKELEVSVIVNGPKGFSRAWGKITLEELNRELAFRIYGEPMWHQAIQKYEALKEPANG